MLTRRNLVVGIAASCGAFCSNRASANDLVQQLAALEGRAGGRLGVAFLDTQHGIVVGHRADERFAMCSTFKFLVAAYVLVRIDRGEETSERRITFADSDVVPHSSVTKHRVDAGMTVSELCRAMITGSDNTAANLLVRSFGGPPAFTAFARSLGDRSTRLDRYEPAMNEAKPGDPRDTTTPAAMLGNLQKLVLQDVLSRGSRRQLADWLISNRTGEKRLRAGFPKDWTIGDKTGSGRNAATNHIAVIWPPGRPPLVVTTYFADSKLSPEARDSVVASVARSIAAAG